MRKRRKKRNPSDRWRRQ